MVKAIDTEYDGHLFRSRLEARWAVFFNRLEIRYEYEQVGFEYEGERYLPDFRLPSLNIWLEVKRDLYAKQDSEEFDEVIAHIKRFAAWKGAIALGSGYPGSHGLVLVGHELTSNGGGLGERVGQFAVCGACHKPTISILGLDGAEWFGNEDYKTPVGCGCEPGPCPYAGDLLSRARQMADTVRFEHGEHIPEVAW